MSVVWIGDKEAIGIINETIHGDDECSYKLGFLVGDIKRKNPLKTTFFRDQVAVRYAVIAAENTINVIPDWYFKKIGFYDYLKQ